MIDQLYVHGFYVVKDFFSKKQADYFLYQSVETIQNQEVYFGGDEDPEHVHPMTYNVNGHPIWENLLYSKVKEVEDIVEEKLIPTYSYQRTYLKGAAMNHHKDWPWCQISLTINLGQSDPYPIFVTDLKTKKSVKVIQEPGDAIFYLGYNISHYRNKFKGDWYSQLFLHYVIDNKEMANNKRFDGDKFVYVFGEEFKDILYSDKTEKVKNVKYKMDQKKKNITEPIDPQMFKSTRRTNPDLKIENLKTDIHMEGGQYNAKPIEHFMDSVHITKGAIPKNICQELIDLYEKYAKDRSVYAGMTFGGIDKNVKDTGELDLCLIPEGEKYIKGLTITSDHCINNYVRKYGMLQHYDPNEINIQGRYYPMWEIHKYEKGVGHYEAWHTEGSHLYEYGNRIFTSMFYLNDVKDGGRTVFPFTRKGIKCEEGKHLAFPTSFPYVHYAETPVSDDKYILTTWYQAVWPENYMRDFVVHEKPTKNDDIKDEITFDFEQV
tara:strand:+ start:5158 stop:6630 length:1473 start_codon:yes stop_codon:yes gene_type:complete